MKRDIASYNQKGIASIMFAMLFIIIISLISIGFATLARRDQRATLDKTLSAQAQLAAETGINKVKEYLANPTPAPAQPNASCIPPNSMFKLPDFTDGVNITCLTWQTNPYEAEFTLQPFESYSFNQKNHTGFTRLEWTTQGASAAQHYGAYPGTNRLPSIVSGNKSIIKVVTVNRTDILNDGNQRAQVFYLVPYNGGDVSPDAVTPASSNTYNDYVDLGNAGVGSLPTERASGLVYYVPCTGDVCSVQIAGYSCPGGVCGAGYGDRLFYFMPMSTQPTSITYKSLDGLNGTAQPLDGIQAKIDVNVIAQDQSKRLVSYVPTSALTSTWQPYFGVSADSLCKDIKIDGSNATSASGGAVCP